MPSWLRRTLIVAGLLLALLVAAAAWLIASFDADRYKGLLIDWVREHKARTLVIDGPIGIGVFPRLEVTLRGVTLSEHQRPDTFATLQEASLSVQLLPLLRQQLAVDRVAARGVHVVYTRDAEGRRNIDDLLAQDEPASSPEAPTSSDPASTLRFDVRAVELANLQATVQDAILGIDGRFAVQKLTTGRLADGAESPLSFVGRAELTQPALNAEVELDGQLKLMLPPGAPAQIAFDDLKLALRGEGFAVKQLDARLTGALEAGGSDGALAARDLKLTLSGERLGLALKDSTLVLDRLAFDPARRALQLEALDLKLAGQRGADTLAATLAWPRLEVNGDALQGSALKGSASLRGAQALQLAFESQAPSGNFERIRVPGLKVAIEGSGGGRTVKGEARADLGLAPQPLAVALDGMDLKLAFTDPALPPMNLALQGEAKAGAKDASWRFAGALNDQRFDASGRADLSRTVPRIEADARFAALDLTRFVKPATTSDAKAPTRADTPVDLSGLKALDGRFTLRAGSLVYPPYNVADAAFDATLAGGVLKVSQLSGRAWGGSFKAQATADAQAQRVGATLDAANVNIAALLSDVAQFQKLEGRGHVTANLDTRGASVNEFKRQLAGRAAFELRDGAVRGINLAKTLRTWRSAITLDKEAVQASRTDEKTDFSEISASFDIAQGVARSKDLDAKSPFLRVGGEGLVDIGQGRVDYLARATVTATPQGQDGAELAALKGVTVPVQLVGPFEAVDYKVRWSAVAADLVGNRAKEAAREAIEKKAKGALGGLLGGALGGAKAPAAAASQPAAPASSPKQQLKEGLKGLFGR